MDQGTRDEKIAKGCLNTLIFLLPILVILFLDAISSDSGSGDDRTRILWQSYDVHIVVSEDGNLHCHQSGRMCGSMVLSARDMPEFRWTGWARSTTCR